MTDKDEVLQAIRKLANDMGYDFFNNGGPPREQGEGEQRETLYLAVQYKEGDERPLLNFVVSWSCRFLVTFNSAKISEYFKDLNQMLSGIKGWLIKNRGAL